MSTTALTNIQELIERTIFESIRVELVDKGYLPDITIYPDTALGALEYEAAIKDVVDDKGFAVEVFSEGSNYAKGNKKVPRIVISTGNFLPGDLGGDPQKFFVNNGTTFSAMVTPPQTSDFYLDIHLVSGNVIQERFLNALLALAIPRRAYLKFYTDNTKSFFIRTLNFSELDDTDHGIIEKVYSYQVPDCWDMEDQVLQASIAKMIEITLNQQVQKYLTNPITPSTDTLVVT